MSTANRSLSIVSAAASVVSLVLLAWVLIGPTAAPWRLWVSLLTALVGTVLGFVDRRAGGNTANSVGAFVGILALVANLGFFAWLLFYKGEVVAEQ